MLYFFNSFGTLLVDVPTVRLFERSICHRYYDGHSQHIPSVLFTEPGEEACKIPQVQSDLGSLVGGKLALDALPGLYFSLKLREAVGLI